MKNKISIVLVLALVVTMLTTIILNKIDDNKAVSSNVSGYEVDLEKEGMNKGDLAPNVEMIDLEGNVVKLSDFRGKKVVLNFWATWCPPCRDEMPHFQAYYEKNKEKENVEIIGFNMTFSGDTQEKVEQFIDRYKLSFPIFLTNDDKNATTYSILSMPTTVFIDEEGRIQEKYVGPLDEKSLAKYVKQLE